MSLQNKENISQDKSTVLGRVLFVLLFVEIYILPLLYFYYLVVWMISGNLIGVGILLAIYVYQLSDYCTESRFFIKLIGAQYLTSYFRNWSCTKESEFKENKCLLVAHPHGIFNLGFVMNKLDSFDNFKCCGSRALLGIPIAGLIYKLLGATDVSAKRVKQMCEQGQNFGLMPGGFEEATINTKKENRIYIKKRKGFIKYALKYGYTIYPSFAFGENQLYNCVEKFQDFRLSLNKYKIPAVLPYSRNFILPDHTKEIHTVIGKPFIMPHIENPSKEDVNLYHEKYIQVVIELYDRYKEKYGEGKKELKIY